MIPNQSPSQPQNLPQNLSPSQTQTQTCDLSDYESDSDEKGFDDIISWVYEGVNDAFQIHDKARFEKEVSIIYFKTTQYKSFQRNLNLWGFRNVYGRKGKYKYNSFPVTCFQQ